MIKYSFYKRGSVYWVQIYFYGKRIQKTTGAKNRKDAETYTRLYISDLLREKELGTDKTFGYIVDKWVAFAQVNKKSFKTNIPQLRAMLNFFGKETRLSEVTPEKVQEFVVFLSTKTKVNGRPIQKSSINRYMALLRTIFNHSISIGLLKENPVKVKKFKEKPRQNYYSSDEIKRLLDAVQIIHKEADHPIQFYFKYIFLVALFTGMRLGEILHLKWSDYKEGTFHITEDKESREKYVPIPDPLYNILLNELPMESEFVFDLKRRSPDIIKNVWNKAKETASIEGRFHDLRRTYAVQLMNMNINIRMIQSLLGHQNITTTQIYTPENLERKKEIINQLKLPT